MTAAALPAATEVAALVALAEEAARTAGRLVQQRRHDSPEGDRPDVAATKSSPTDVVTEADRSSERLLRDLLAAARPSDAVLGEEYGGAGAGGITWVIDPIDGTVNYLYGLPAYAVSVAAVIGDPGLDGGWQPVAGCVHNPATGETFTAGLGQGARLDGRPLRLGPPPALDGALVATGFGYDAQRRAGQAQVLGRVLPQVRDIRRLGAAALDLCMVAAGRVDAYYERGTHVWDVAAGTLVLTEAGGVVRGLAGAPPGEPMVVAAAPALADALAAALVEAGAGSQP